MIPLLVDLSGKLVVIFGGGDVGARKAAFFASEARVRVFSRSFSPGFDALAAECVKVDLDGIPTEDLGKLLEGSCVVVAATPDRALNDRIGALCRERGIHFNNAEGEAGDLVIPSVVRGRQFLLAITTTGASPAVSRYLREFLQESLPGLDGMIRLQQRLRSRLRRVQPDAERRRELLWKVLKDRDAWAAVERDEEEAWNMIEERYFK